MNHMDSKIAKFTVLQNFDMPNAEKPNFYAKTRNLQRAFYIDTIQCIVYNITNGRLVHS